MKTVFRKEWQAQTLKEWDGQMKKFSSELFSEHGFHHILFRLPAPELKDGVYHGWMEAELDT